MVAYFTFLNSRFGEAQKPSMWRLYPKPCTRKPNPIDARTPIVVIQISKNTEGLFPGVPMIRIIVFKGLVFLGLGLYMGALILVARNIEPVKKFADSATQGTGGRLKSRS